MEQSLFIDYINKYQRGIITRVVETLNGKQNGTPSYLHRQMLRKEFSVTGMWESISTLNTRVSADFVAMDSSLPLKRRDAIQKASGEIVKSGMELWLNERQLTELITMTQLRSVQESDIVARLFTDTPRVITGIYELMEKAFLQGLSTGVTEIISDDKNTGISIRIDYGYPVANKFGVSILWDSPATAKPLDDLRRIIKKARDTDGNTLTEVWMDDVTFDRMIATDQVKKYFAWSISYLGAADNVPSPTLEQLNGALQRDQRYRCTIHIVDRTVLNEKNGIRTTEKPWQEGMVILTTSTQVGVLTWAQLAEMISPVAGVSYQTADDYILLSRFSTNRPSLMEYTTSQARVVPVICNVDSIYQLDISTIQA